MDDSELTQRLKQKEELALEELIRKYTPLVATIVNNAARGLLSKEDREEVVTDVFVTLWNNSGNIMENKLKGYLCRIAKTRALNKLTSAGKYETLPLDGYDPEDDFVLTAKVETKEMAVYLRQMIAELEMPEREIMIRYYYYSQNTSKISAVMGMNVETVKSKLRRTRLKIKEKLLERGYV